MQAPAHSAASGGGEAGHASGNTQTKGTSKKQDVEDCLICELPKSAEAKLESAGQAGELVNSFIFRNCDRHTDAVARTVAEAGAVFLNRISKPPASRFDGLVVRDGVMLPRKANGPALDNPHYTKSVSSGLWIYFARSRLPETGSRRRHVRTLYKIRLSKLHTVLEQMKIAEGALRTARRDLMTLGDKDFPKIKVWNRSRTQQGKMSPQRILLDIGSEEVRTSAKTILAYLTEGRCICTGSDKADRQEAVKIAIAAARKAPAEQMAEPYVQKALGKFALQEVQGGQK